MSGGSFNYLHYAAELGMLTDRLDLVRAMVAFLASQGDTARPAADASKRVLELLEQANAEARKLADIWHTAEWLKSGDHGPEELRKAVARFMLAARSADRDAAASLIVALGHDSEAAAKRGEDAYWRGQVEQCEELIAKLRVLMRQPDPAPPAPQTDAGVLDSPPKDP